MTAILSRPQCVKLSEVANDRSESFEYISALRPYLWPIVTNEYRSLSSNDAIWVRAFESGYIHIIWQLDLAAELCRTAPTTARLAMQCRYDKFAATQLHFNVSPTEALYIKLQLHHPSAWGWTGRVECPSIVIIDALRAGVQWSIPVQFNRVLPLDCQWPCLVRLLGYWKEWTRTWFSTKSRHFIVSWICCSHIAWLWSPVSE